MSAAPDTVRANRAKEDSRCPSAGSSPTPIMRNAYARETYRTGPAVPEEAIEEQSQPFGSKPEYGFDYGAVRSRVEAIARENGYSFESDLLAS
jgi:hypothetical protein